MSIATISSTGKQNETGPSSVMYSNYIYIPNENNGNIYGIAYLTTSVSMTSISDMWNYIISHGDAESQYRYKIPCGGTYINALTPNILGNITMLKASSNYSNHVTVCYQYIDSNGDITYGEFDADYFADIISVVI